MAPLRPTDIDRPRAARAQGANARPVTVQLARIRDPRGAALEDMAQGTRGVAAATNSLARRTAQEGSMVGEAMRGVARTAFGAGESAQRSSEYATQAHESFARALGTVSDAFLQFASRRQKTQDEVFANAYELRKAQNEVPVIAEHLNAPQEGPGYIAEGDQKLTKVHKSTYDETVAELGYEPSVDGRQKIEQLDYSSRISAAKHWAVESNNARVASLVETASDSVMRVARTAGSTGDLASGLADSEVAIDTLEEVLPPAKLSAAREAAKEQVVKAVVMGHLERGEVDQARTLVDSITGFAGPAANEVHQSIIGAFKNEGVDPLLGLAISRRETGGTFDPASKTWIDKKTGQRASSASGLFHMIDDTSVAYLGRPDAASLPIAKQAEGGAKLTADNMRGLRRFLKGEPTPGEVYLAHVLGLGGAKKVIGADPETPLNQVLSPKEIANSAPGLANKTVADMVAWSEQAMKSNMEYVLKSGVMEGRSFDENLASVPIETGMQLSASVAATEKRIWDQEQKKVKDFSENFSKLKPRKDRDPAGTLHTYNAEVRQAFDVAATIMASDADIALKTKAWHKALDTSLAYQKELGLSERDAKALPVEHAKTMVNTFAEAKGTDAVRMFYELKEMAGGHFNKIYGELTEQGLTGDFMTLAVLDPVMDAAQVSSVERIIGVSTTDLKKDLPPTTETELLNPLEDELSEFRRAYELRGPGARERAGGIVETAKKVALDHYRVTGNLVESLRRGAELVNANIEVVETSTIHAVVPKEYGIDDATLEETAEFMQLRAKIDEFDPLTIGTPEPIPSAGMLTRGNINLATRPMVKQGDGSIATVAPISINVDGKEVLISTVSDDGRMMGKDEAVRNFHETGQHLGIFDTAENADNYAIALHNQQEEYYGFGRERTRQTAARYGQWVTNKAGDGMILMVPFGASTAMFPLTNAKGDPFEIKFVDVPRLAKEAKIANAPTTIRPPGVIGMMEP